MSTNFPSFTFLGKHYTFYYRYHLGWITKYRYKVLQGDIRLRIREIIGRFVVRTGSRSSRVCRPAITCICSCRSPLSVSDLMRKMKGRSSHKVQRKFPQLKKRYWGRHFWGRGYFSTNNGAITDDIVIQYLESHSDKSTDASRQWFN